MNTPPTPASPPPDAQHAPRNTEHATRNTPNSNLLTPNSSPPLPRRSPSKIAQLPKPVRDRLNQLLADGVTYRVILEQLGPAAAHINQQNLSNWRRGPHQQWLAHRQDLEDHVTNLDFAADLLAHDTATLHEAALRLAAARLLNLLARLQDQPDPLANYDILNSLVNALCRLSRETVRCERQRDESAQNQLLRSIATPVRTTTPPPPAPAAPPKPQTVCPANPSASDAAPFKSEISNPKSPQPAPTPMLPTLPEPAPACPVITSRDIRLQDSFEIADHR